MAMRRVVLPILRDWQPDYIINAAGQDNHYSDPPLTNMNFSAGGYARLTELLAPDIVVLEGGYSIETALPYINVGLLLALAGLDYSKVREPTWQRKAVTQSASLTREVARICDEVAALWATRSEADLGGEIFGTGEFYERKRQIYYDTDNIYESQQEYISLCPDCAGWRVIYTASNAAKKPAAAVLVPWGAPVLCVCGRRRSITSRNGPTKGWGWRSGRILALTITAASKFPLSNRNRHIFPPELFECESLGVEVERCPVSVVRALLFS